MTDINTSEDVMDVITALPPRSAELLEELAHKANKQTGIAQPKDFERFCKFAIVAHLENVDLPEDCLSAYFERNGWSAENATAAAKRFKAACFMLKMYDDTKSGKLQL